jgi:hypothetical protein
MLARFHYHGSGFSLTAGLDARSSRKTRKGTNSHLSAQRVLPAQISSGASRAGVASSCGTLSFFALPAGFYCITHPSAGQNVPW